MFEHELARAFDDGRLRWPGAKLDPSVFARRAADLEVGPEHLLARGSDLYLAWACAEQDAAALNYFEREFLTSVARYVGRLGLRGAAVEEVKQELRIRLLLGNEPRIARYGGRGPLGAWLRVAAMRVALTLCERDKARGRSSEIEALGALVGDEITPEGDAIRRRHVGKFQEALEKSLDALPSRDKTILRMHFIDQLNIDAIGRVYAVHRATAARWIIAIRRRVLDNLRAELNLDLRTTTSEFRSMLTVVRGDLEVSLRHLFSAESAPARPESSSC